MNSTNLEIVVKLRDEATSKLSSIGGSLRSMNIPLAAVATAAAAAGTAVIAFGISAIKGYGEAQVSAAKMTKTVENTFDSFKAAKLNKLQEEVNDAFGEGTDVVDGYIQFIGDLSQATVKLGFDDEAAAESIAKLFQRTGDLTKATELNNLAMDLARAKSISLEDASNLVGQVLSGNGKILKQYGIEISDTLPPMKALDELQKQVAGNAAAFAETFPGQMLVLQESWSNIKDAIGQVLVESLTPFVKEFTDWLLNPETQKSFKQWTADFKSWAEVVIPLVIDVFKAWGAVLKGIYDIMISIGTAISDALEKFTAFSSKLDNSKFGKGTANGGGLIGGISALFKANGGPVTEGAPYIVGERGPELFVPATSGSIIPNGAGGGGITVNINGGTYLSEDAARKMGDMIITQFLRINKL